MSKLIPAPAQLNERIVEKCEEDSDSNDEEQDTPAEIMGVATKLEYGTPGIGGCSSGLLVLCREFGVEPYGVTDWEVHKMTLDCFVRKV